MIKHTAILLAVFSLALILVGCEGSGKDAAEKIESGAKSLGKSVEAATSDLSASIEKLDVTGVRTLLNENSTLRKDIESLEKLIHAIRADRALTINAGESLVIEAVNAVGPFSLKAWVGDEDTNVVWDIVSPDNTLKTLWTPSSKVTGWIKDRGRNQYEHTLPTIKSEVQKAFISAYTNGWGGAVNAPEAHLNHGFKTGRHTVGLIVRPMNSPSPAWSIRILISKKLANKEKELVTAIDFNSATLGTERKEFKREIEIDVNG